MRRALVAIPIVLACLAPRVALARRGLRPLFEPTDLELEAAGAFEADVQVGMLRAPGGGPWRTVVPDFELDVGVTRGLEIDIDGAFAVEGTPTATGTFRQAAPETLWIAAKLGLLDWADDTAAPSDGPTVWALGAQIGPRFPVAPGTSGVGLEALMLFGHVVHHTHFVLNTGAFVDPSPTPGASRPVGVELGLDVMRELDAAGRFSLMAELAGVRFVSRYPHIIVATGGFAWSITPETEVSILGIFGFLSGGDHYGALVGVAQKVRIFEP